MKLKEYRKLRGISAAEFGKLIGKTSVDIYRYEAGKITPNNDVVEAIYLQTRGAVEPNDFHNLPRIE